METDISCTETPKSCRWIASLAQVLIIAAMAATSGYVIQQMTIEHFVFWPYLAYTICVVLVFTMYGFVTLDKD